MYIQPEKLKEFKAALDGNWTGEESDKCGSKDTEPPFADRTPNSETHLNEVEESPILTTPIRKSLSDSPSIPTPFKKALFFPSEKEKTKTKRKREKIPPVVSSQLWQNYSESKKAKKEHIEREKNERKIKREEKKKEKEELMLSKKERLNKRKKETSVVPKRCLKFDDESNTSENEDEDLVCEDTDQDCDMETFSDFEEGQKMYGINDFVIVYYEGEYFPGQIKELRTNNDDKTGQEYLVTVMTMSGPNGWRWPDPEDKIWYVEGQILERISPPSTTNSHGV